MKVKGKTGLRAGIGLGILLTLGSVALMASVGWRVHTDGRALLAIEDLVVRAAGLEKLVIASLWKILGAFILAVAGLGLFVYAVAGLTIRRRLEEGRGQ